MTKSCSAHKPSLAGLLILMITIGYSCWSHLRWLDHNYLPGWDEAIHAAVSQNLSKHPLKPTLFDKPFISLDYRNWQKNHVWLHMPPMPFWLVSVSLAIQPSSFFALRFPSFLLFVGTLVVIYFLGLMLYSEAAGLLGALMYAISPFVWLQVQGYHFGDMTDVGLAFWLSLCILACIRSHSSGCLVWSAVCGLSQAAALLSKSALALAPAGAAVVVWVLSRTGQLTSKAKWTHLILHLGPGLGLWWAWRLYAKWNWPQEYAWETRAQWLHVTTSYEGHGRSAYELLNDLLSHLFSPLLVVLGLAASIWLLLYCVRKRHLGISFHVLWIVGTWLPLNLVTTKVPAVLFGIAPALALAMSVLILRMASRPHHLWAVAIAVVPFVAWLTDRWFGLYPAHPMPKQLLIGFCVYLLLLLATWGIKRFAPRILTPFSTSGAHLVLIGLLSFPLVHLLHNHVSTRQGFSIIADYNPISKTAKQLQHKITPGTCIMIEGTTNGRQRPDLGLSFLLDTPVHMVPGHLLGQTIKRAQKSCQELVLLTPIQRQAQPLITPSPGNTYWSYRIDTLPPVVLDQATALMARYETGPDLIRFEPEHTRLPAGSTLKILNYWRTKGPTSQHATKVLLEALEQPRQINPYPLEQDFPSDYQAVHLHKLAPAGLFWGRRPFGNSLAEPQRWKKDWIIADDFFIFLPTHLPYGKYRLIQQMLLGPKPEPPLADVDWPIIEILAP